MTKIKIDNETQNPILLVSDLIKRFDHIVSSQGVIPPYIGMKFIDDDQSKENLLETFQSILEAQGVNALVNHYHPLAELVAEIIVHLESDSSFNKIEKPELPKICHSTNDNIKSLLHYVFHLKVEIKPLIDNQETYENENSFLRLLDKKRSLLNIGFFYEFTDGDINRIQILINELRAEISKSDLFEEDHRSRLLKRLERLQAEMHKKMSDIDRFWGLIGDAGVALGKFGKDAKPIVDRIKELSQIAWRTQSRAEELPSGSHNPLIEEQE